MKDLLLTIEAYRYEAEKTMWMKQKEILQEEIVKAKDEVNLCQQIPNQTLKAGFAPPHPCGENPVGNFNFFPTSKSYIPHSNSPP